MCKGLWKNEAGGMRNPKKVHANKNLSWRFVTSEGDALQTFCSCQWGVAGRGSPQLVASKGLLDRRWPQLVSQDKVPGRRCPELVCQKHTVHVKHISCNAASSPLQPNPSDGQWNLTFPGSAVWSACVCVCVA